MNDLIPNYGTRLYTDAASKKLSPSFYWAIGIALLLHALVIYYLVTQSFPALIDKQSIPEQNPIVVTVDRPTPPAKPMPAPANKVMFHATPYPTDPKQDLIQVDPPKTITDSGSKTPPVISTGSDMSSSASSSGDGFVTARWAAFPNGATLSEYYPPRALDNEVEGVVTVQCTVLDTQGHVACTVVSEIPGGYGFGRATVNMVQAKGRVDTTQGDVKVGSVLQTKVKWQLG